MWADVCVFVGGVGGGKHVNKKLRATIDQGSRQPSLFTIAIPKSSAIVSYCLEKFYFMFNTIESREAGNIVFNYFIRYL